MARTAIQLVVQSPASGAAIANATVTVTRTADASAPPVYLGRTGTSTLGTNVLTSDANGRLTNAGTELFLEQGTYSYAVTGAGLTAIALVRESVSGDGIAETTPPGAMLMWPAAAAPTGWQLCDGSAISRVTFAKLFAAIGTTYGNGNGSTTFNVPDMRQRFPLGQAAAGTGSALAASGGQIDHVHTVAAHTHTLPAHTHGLGTLANATAVTNITAATSVTGASVTNGLHNHGGLTGSGVTSTGTTGTGTTGTGTTGTGTTGTGTTGNDSPDHTHAFPRTTNQPGAAGASNSYGLVGQDFGFGPDVTSGASARHTHSVPGLSIPSLTTSAHSVPGLSIPALSVPQLSIPNSASNVTFNDASHTHTITDPGHTHGHTGTIGTGAVSGDTAMTSGSSALTTDATNPPFLTVNFIIRHGNQ